VPVLSADSSNQAQQARRRPVAGALAIRTGFTLVDVLVTMAVIAVLISLLAPSLSSVRETAHQVVCRSNTRQLGIGINMYAEDHLDRLPPTTNLDAQQNSPWETMTLRLNTGAWDGLGHLYNDEYLPAPKLYYCPSHRGYNPYRSYEDQWGGVAGNVVGNYQYRGRGPAAGMVNGATSRYLSEIKRNSALIADGLRNQSDFNHIVGTNLLRADLSVTWFADTNGRLYEAIPKDGQMPNITAFENAWDILDD
jgi:type II secretory pathway pseudopilin PulG